LVNGRAQGTGSALSAATLNRHRLANVSVSATVTLGSSASDNVGLIARFQDADNYYAAVITTDGNGHFYANIYLYHGGIFSNLFTTPPLEWSQRGPRRGPALRDRGQSIDGVGQWCDGGERKRQHH